MPKLKVVHNCMLLYVILYVILYVVIGGLRNTGNTCFLNASAQLIINTPNLQHGKSPSYKAGRILYYVHSPTERNLINGFLRCIMIERQINQCVQAAPWLRKLFLIDLFCVHYLQVWDIETALHVLWWHWSGSYILAPRWHQVRLNVYCEVTFYCGWMTHCTG